jgi:hypothetical protein
VKRGTGRSVRPYKDVSVAERVFTGRKERAMSRHYEMTVTISGHDPAKESQIQSAVAAEWPFDDWSKQGEGEMCSCAQDDLCGGESEEVFAERLSLAVWRANGAYCKVVVKATYLEDLPYETHSPDEDDYARLITDKNTENEEG